MTDWWDWNYWVLTIKKWHFWVIWETICLFYLFLKMWLSCLILCCAVTWSPEEVMVALGTLSHPGRMVCAISGNMRTLVPVRAKPRPHCHFMVTSADLFIESNQRKSMPVTFVVHLFVLVQEEKKEADWERKGQAHVHTEHTTLEL